MNEAQSNNHQEIDLVFLFKKINSFFIGVGVSTFRFFEFLNKKKVILILLLLIGLLFGFIYDRYSVEKFKTELIVVPNFESTEYLYSEIDNFNKKIPKDKESKFYFDNIIDIEIKPLIDIKSIIKNQDNREFFKILTENGQKFENIQKDKNILKTNKLHLITITTKRNDLSKDIVLYILRNLNKSKYYSERRKYEVENLTFSKIQLQKSINQINVILDRIGSEKLDNTGKGLSINTYEQLNNVIDLKRSYVEMISEIDTKLIESNSIIFPVNISYDNEFLNKFYLSGKFIFPLLFLFLFLIYSSLVNFCVKYSKISRLRNAN